MKWRVPLWVVIPLVLFSAAAGAFLYSPIKGALSTSGFCEAASDWHATFAAYLVRANSEGSRDKEGLPETKNVFRPNLLVVLPHANGEDEEDLRELLKAATSRTEQWLSDLELTNGAFDIAANTSDASAQATLLSKAFDTWQRAEEQRIEGNAVLREASYQVERMCGLDPLPIYRSQRE